MTARDELIMLIDERIELALAAQHRKSLDLYRKGRDGIPEPASVPGGDVYRVVDSASRGLVGSELSNQVDKFTHDFAPSRDGEGSVGAPRPQGSAPAAGDDTEASA